MAQRQRIQQIESELDRLFNSAVRLHRHFDAMAMPEAADDVQTVYTWAAVYVEQLAKLRTGQTVPPPVRLAQLALPF
jgi:hypothetical protein